MSISQLLTLPVTILRRTVAEEIDEFGNEVDTAPAEEVETVGELQQRQRDEQTAGGDVVATTWALYLPADTEIDAGDGIVAGGATYEVDGEPWPVRNPRTGVVSHIEATVRRTGGSGGAS